MNIFFRRKKEEPTPSPLPVGEFNRPFHLDIVKEEVANNPHFLGGEDIAIAVNKVAELIAENFPSQEIRFMVEAKDLAENAPEGAFPVHFVFYKDGKPKVAVVITSVHAIRVPGVIKTTMLCERNGIEYVRIYANGTFADWITGIRNNEPTPDHIVEFCKNRNVEKIREGLNK